MLRSSSAQWTSWIRPTQWTFGSLASCWRRCYCCCCRWCCRRCFIQCIISIPKKMHCHVYFSFLFLISSILHSINLSLPEPVFWGCFTIHFGHKVANKWFLIECSKVGAQEIMTNPVYTVMIQLFNTRVKKNNKNWNTQTQFWNAWKKF